MEEDNLDLAEIDYITFNQDKYNKIYNELITANSLLKDGLMKTYDWIENEMDKKGSNLSKFTKS